MKLGNGIEAQATARPRSAVSWAGFANLQFGGETVGESAHSSMTSESDILFWNVHRSWT
jgi:hypothetical protein